MAGLCEDCGGCCETFEVRELSKPFGVRCIHLGATGSGLGCQIYDTRPQACKNYVCLWLDSQRRQSPSDRLPEELRPDVSKCVLGWPWGIERETLHVYTYQGHPDAWRKGAVAEHIKMVLARGGKIVVYVNKDRIYSMRGDMAVVGTEQEFADLLTDEKEPDHVG